MADDKPPESHEGAVRAAGVAIVGTTMSDWEDYASPAIRDAFLASLDEQDDARALAIARHLVRCGNPLPSVACAALGIANGSSYGNGALAVLACVTLK